MATTHSHTHSHTVTQSQSHSHTVTVTQSHSHTLSTVTQMHMGPQMAQITPIANTESLNPGPVDALPLEPCRTEPVLKIRAGGDSRKREMVV